MASGDGRLPAEPLVRARFRRSQRQHVVRRLQAALDDPPGRARQVLGWRSVRLGTCQREELDSPRHSGPAVASRRRFPHRIRAQCRARTRQHPRNVQSRQPLAAGCRLVHHRSECLTVHHEQVDQPTRSQGARDTGADRDRLLGGSCASQAAPRGRCDRPAAPIDGAGGPEHGLLLQGAATARPSDGWS
jgi:hypothetical protein